MCCFPAKHASLRRKSKDRLPRNQNIPSGWGDMSIHELLFQWASTIEIQLSVLVWNKADLVIISLKTNLFSRHDIADSLTPVFMTCHTITNSIKNSTCNYVIIHKLSWYARHSKNYFFLKIGIPFQIKMSFNNRKKRKEKEFGENNKEFRHGIQ